MGPSGVGGVTRRLLTLFGLSAALALPAAMMGAPPALAYEGCQDESGMTSSSTVVNGGDSFTVTATIRDCNGSGVEGEHVVFGTDSGPRGCHASFDPREVITDANGVATTQVTLPSKCPCQYTLSADDNRSHIHLTTTVRENGCLPFTTAAAASKDVTLPGQASGTPEGLLLGLAVLLIVAATGMAIRRRI
jgi:hypothetical protein